MSTLFWKRFLVDAGIPVRAADSYTTAFVENRITETMVSDLNKNILVDLGITIIGDVIAILKHAIRVTEEQSSEQKKKIKEKQKKEQKKKTPPPPKPESEKKPKRVIKAVKPIEAPERATRPVQKAVEKPKMIPTVRKPTVVKGEKRAPASEETTTTKRPKEVHIQRTLVPKREEVRAPKKEREEARAPITTTSTKETVIRRVIPSEQTVRCVSPDSTTSHRSGTIITLNRVLRDDDNSSDIKVEKKRKVISWSPERASNQKVKFHTTISDRSGVIKPTSRPQAPSTLMADRLEKTNLRAARLETTNARAARLETTKARAARLETTKARAERLNTLTNFRADRLNTSTNLRADMLTNTKQNRVIRTSRNNTGRTSDGANSFRSSTAATARSREAVVTLRADDPQETNKKHVSQRLQQRKERFSKPTRQQPVPRRRNEQQSRSSVFSRLTK